MSDSSQKATRLRLGQRVVWDGHDGEPQPCVILGMILPEACSIEDENTLVRFDDGHEEWLDHLDLEPA